MKELNEDDLLQAEQIDCVTLIIAIFDRLLNCYEIRHLPNYFLPEQNIFDVHHEEKLTEGTKFLQNYFCDAFHLAKLVREILK